MTNIVSFCIIFSNKIYKFVTNYNSMKVLVEEVEKKVQELVLLYASVKKEFSSQTTRIQEIFSAVFRDAFLYQKHLPGKFQN